MQSLKIALEVNRKKGEGKGRNKQDRRVILTRNQGRRLDVAAAASLSVSSARTDVAVARSYYRSYYRVDGCSHIASWLPTACVR